MPIPLIELLNTKENIGTSRPRHNDRDFAGDIYENTLLKDSFFISMQISLKSVLKGSIHKRLTLVSMMAWRRSGDMPSSESMMTKFSDVLF